MDKPLLFLFSPVHEGKRAANTLFLFVHLSLRPGRKVTRITVFTRRHNGFYRYPCPDPNLLFRLNAHFRSCRMNMTGSLPLYHSWGLAARTAPKAKGIDSVVTGILTGDVLASLSDEMKDHGGKKTSFFYQICRKCSRISSLYHHWYPRTGDPRNQLFRVRI